AKTTVDEANSKAGKINEMSSTVRSMLSNEIEGVNRQFRSLSEAIQNLAGQTSERMKEAQTIIGEAKKVIEPNDNNTVKLAEVPTASAPKAETSKADSPVSANQFANVAGGSYNRDSAPAGLNSSKPVSSKPSPAPVPAKEAPKPAVKKPVSNFNFDMSDLLKEAEEAARGQQS
ncbi:MAG: hypothetical protein K2N49_00710, partial [Ruminococcus sp.]|nr:hypothetical protein [Ruminococcus sp.]